MKYIHVTNERSEGRLCIFWEIETRRAGAITKGSVALPNSTLSVYERIMRVYHLDFVYMPTCPLSLSSQLAVGAVIIFENALVFMDNNQTFYRILVT